MRSINDIVLPINVLLVICRVRDFALDELNLEIQRDQMSYT